MAKDIEKQSRQVLSGACFVIAVAATSTALAQVDIRSPWANVYVGPGGVYVHGPWGRVDVPSADRERVCDQWRESIRNHYKGQNCKVTFNDDNCTIKDVDCADEGGKETNDKVKAPRNYNSPAPDGFFQA